MKAGFVVLTAFHVVGCASPPQGEPFVAPRAGSVELELGASLGPGTGFVLGAAQRMHDAALGRLDFEADYTHQEVDRAVSSEGRAGDDFDQLRLGLRLVGRPDETRGWTGRAGIVWLRLRGDADSLDEPGDFAGAYAGFGYELRIEPRLVTGPDLTVALLDREGSGDGGVLTELAWRIGWRF